MKKLIYSAMAIVFIAIACENDDNDNNNTGSNYTEQTVSMGSNSTKDVYYSLADGETASAERSDWDIAFSVPLQTATILINEGAGVELYSVGDTNDWETLDETSIEGRSKLYNNKSDLSIGAFNVYATGFPNYGWGTYHAGADHNVGGDSLYIIRLSDSTLKKFMVRVKLGANSTNIVRWADLDGENEVIASIGTTPYFEKKHFIHFSLVNNEIVELEPDMGNWDFVFTRYMTRIPVGPGAFMDYPVMGLLSNPDVTVAEITGDPETIDLNSLTPDFSDDADVIGHDWKISDPVTHEISLADSISYLIESVDGNTYHMYFTEYGGNTAGTIKFKVRKIE